MPLLTGAIAALCLNVQTGYSTACNKAVEAGSKQSTVYQSEETIEESIKTDLKKHFSKEVLSAAAVVGFTYKTIKDRSLSFELPNLGLCQSINNKIDQSAYSINFKWEIK